MSEKREDVITVTVSAPAGKRALVTHYGKDETNKWTVVGGTSQNIYARENDVIRIQEGPPHHEVAPGADPA